MTREGLMGGPRSDSTEREGGRKGWRAWELLPGPGAEIPVVQVAQFWVGAGAGVALAWGGRVK